MTKNRLCFLVKILPAERQTGKAATLKSCISLLNQIHYLPVDDLVEARGIETVKKKKKKEKFIQI